MKQILVIASLILSATISFAQNSTSSTTESVSAMGAGSISEPAKIIETIKKPSKWQTSLWYAPNAGVADANRGNSENSSSADAFAQVRRDIGNGQKLALRINAAQDQTDPSENNEWELTDPQILYSFPAFASTLRLSLPTSEWSQDIGRYELRYNGGVDMFKSGRFTLTGLGEARGYAYTKEEDGQRAARARLGATAMFEINQYVSPYVLALYQWDSNYHGTGISMNEGKTQNPESRVDKTIVDAGAEINIIPKTLNLNAYIEQERARNAGNENQLFAEETSTYYLEFTLSM